MANSAARASNTRATSARCRENTAGTPALQNARLLARDRFQALAQESFVIEIHRRDHAQLGHHHIRGIQPSAQPDFQHHRIHALVAKDQKRHRGHGFEVGGVQIDRAFVQQLLHALVYRVERVGELRGGNRPPVDADAFGGFGQMRRSV